MRRRGYVYTDVLTTLLILMIVYGLFLANMRNGLVTSRKTTCLHNLQQVGHSLKVYALDYSGAFPPQAAGLSSLVDTYAADAGILACPQVAIAERHERPRYLANATYLASASSGPIFIDYCYRAGLAGDDLPTTGIVADKLAHTHRDGANTLFVDGSVMWRPCPAMEAGTLLAPVLEQGGLDARTEERVRTR
jgi:prepilin-type processing-associated H-X9-DG protein